MECKVSQVRNYILEQLEDGSLLAGDKLDGARDIARKTGVCFAKVQQSLDLLARDGVLESISRKGTFVQKNWKDRILTDNFKIFSPSLPWVQGLKEMIAGDIPDLRICSGFDKAVFEIKTTWDVEAEQDEFIDLREIFEQAYPDSSIFYSHPFKSFYCGNRLIGIPVIFSPRIMFYNAEILKKHGCPEPKQGWTWDDLMESIKILKNKLPPQNIINWIPQPFFFMNFIFRAGGGLISADENNTVLIDHPDTVRGLELFKKMGVELGYGKKGFSENNNLFCEGNAAFSISTRQMVPMLNKTGMTDWNTIHLPLIPGGADITAQATDLLCIRKSCTDTETAVKLVSLLLSEKFQNHLGRLKYGIPVRKSAALKSIDVEDPKDSIFILESIKASAEYKIDSRESARFISEGIRLALMSSDDLRKSLEEIASALRTMLKVRRQSI